MLLFGRGDRPKSIQFLADMAGAASVLQVLARLPRIAASDFASFQDRATYALTTISGNSIVMSQPDGMQVINTLRRPHPHNRMGDPLAKAAYILAGSAGIFGFQRLSIVRRSFEQAVQSGATETPAIADALGAAIEATLQEIHARMTTSSNDSRL